MWERQVTAMREQRVLECDARTIDEDQYRVCAEARFDHASPGRAGVAVTACSQQLASGSKQQPVCCSGLSRVQGAAASHSGT